MKMQPDRLEGVNTISRLETGRIWVHQTPFDHSILLPARGTVQPWDVQRYSELQPRHFESILSLSPELVILGTGDRLRFPAPGLWKCLIAAGIGFEAMDTPAACRTYNVLASEGRKVTAALLVEKEQA